MLQTHHMGETRNISQKEEKLMEDDIELMRQINEHADNAEQAKPKMTDLRAFAAVLASHFDHRGEDEIFEQCKTVWRARGLYWVE